MVKHDLNTNDILTINYALGLLYQFMEDDILDINEELETKGYTDIITMDRVINIVNRLSGENV